MTYVATNMAAFAPTADPGFLGAWSSCWLLGSLIFLLASRLAKRATKTNEELGETNQYLWGFGALLCLVLCIAGLIALARLGILNLLGQPRTPFPGL